MNNRKTILIALSSIVVICLLVLGVPYIPGSTLAQNGDDKNSSQSSSEVVVNDGSSVSVSSASEVVVEDLVVGSGPEAVAGATITVDYIGTNTNGTKFASTLDSGEPFSFVLGAGEVIQGWDQGVAGMKVGGKRKLTIPAELGDGSRIFESNSTSIFEVELLEVS
jgi:FKBP-type peptidyl-prolyl cis-trans isomerase